MAGKADVGGILGTTYSCSDVWSNDGVQIIEYHQQGTSLCFWARL